VRLEGLGQLKKIHLIGIRTRDLPVCSIEKNEYGFVYDGIIFMIKGKVVPVHN
jgi:hypothetical protein